MRIQTFHLGDFGVNCPPPLCAYRPRGLNMHQSPVPNSLLKIAIFAANIISTGTPRL